MQRPALILALLLSLSLSGCGTLGLWGSEDDEATSDENPESADNKDEDDDPRSAQSETDRRPTGIGGVDSSEEDGLVDSIFGSDGPAAAGANRAEMAELRQEIARLQASMEDRQPRRQPASARERTGPGVAVVFPQGAALQAPMLSALNQAAGSFPVRLITPGDVTPVLNNYGCDAAAPSDCLSALAVQPGARLLAVIEPLRASDENQQRVRFRFYDTDLGLRYDPVTLALPQNADGPQEQSWIAAADAVLLHAQDHLQLTPTIVHAVKTEGETVYLNQGQAAGLKRGSRLSVHADGRVIRGVADLPVTWIPGPLRGTVEVTRVTANGRAVGRVVEGETPEPSDFLVPEDGNRG
jgi:hypothetical protein